MNSFEELEVWKASQALRNSIWKLTKTFPKEELYRLSDQLIRASRSVSANIAEGFGRFHFQENIQFCRQERGSLFEMLEHIICSYDINYIQENEYIAYRNQIFNCIKILNGYILYLKKAKLEENIK
ncbi:MAG: four helix bundle protein [Bacteroidetes bacterium]|nr:four helix bundle protein [Bacteroidota bacterium]